MKKSLKLFAATTAVVVAFSCATGITLAVDSSVGGSGNAQSGTVVTASLELSAKTSGLAVYSAVEAADGDTNVFLDENGVKYKYVQSTVQSGRDIAFDHGGSVVCSENNVAVNGMMPGDKIEFDIEITSKSTISFNYRTELYVDASKGAALLDELNFSANGLSLYRRDGVTDQDASVGEISALMTDYTEWKVVSGNQAAVEKVHVTISLPMTAKCNGGNADDGKTDSGIVKIKYVASGVQNPDIMPDVAETESATGTVKFKSLSDAVDYAAKNGVSEIKIIGNGLIEEGSVVVPRAMRFTGVPTEGKLPELKGARISFKNAASATFDGVAFTGASYIDVSDGTALTLRNCKANVSGVRYFDESARKYLSDPAFIVSGSSLTDTLVTLENNVFDCGKNAAVCVRKPLSDGSAFIDNVFGAQDKAYDGTAVVMLEGAKSGATIKFERNTVYGKLPVSLGTAGEEYDRFKFISRDNTAYSIAEIFVAGTSGSAVLDTGSVLNGTALSVGNIGKTTLFGGVNVTVDGMERVTAGVFELYGMDVADFYNRYVAVGALQHNVITLCKNGVPDAYLNSSNNVEKYVVDKITSI